MSKAARMLGTQGTPPANTVVDAPDDEDDDKPKKALGSGAVLMEGMLQKKSPKGLMFKAWQDRYFKLYAGAIEYYKKPNDPAPAGNINILAVKFVLAKADKNATRFDLVTGDPPTARTYSMLAKDTKDRDRWVAAITEAVKKAFTPAESKQKKDDTGSAAAAGAGAGAKDNRPEGDPNDFSCETPKAKSNPAAAAPIAAAASPTAASKPATAAVPPSPKNAAASGSATNSDDSSSLPAHLRPGAANAPPPTTPKAAAASAAGAGAGASAVSPAPGAGSTGGTATAARTIGDVKASYDVKKRARNVVHNPVEPADFQVQVYHTERVGPFGALFHARSKTHNATHYVLHTVSKLDGGSGHGSSGNAATGSAAQRTADALKLFDVMKQLKPHPYLLRYVHGGETEDTVFAAYTPAIDKYTTLAAYLRVHTRFPESVVKLIGAQVLLALGALHEQNLHARNLSSETVHIDADGNAVFADVLLGLDLKAMPKEALPPTYQPPETITNAHVRDDTRVSDYWRLGVLLFELATGVAPWSIAKPEDGTANGAAANGVAGADAKSPNGAAPNGATGAATPAAGGADEKGKADNKAFEHYPFVLPYAEELDAKEHYTRCALIAALQNDGDYASASYKLPAGAAGVELSPKLMDLLKLLLVRDPKQRLASAGGNAAAELELIRSHPWFAEYNGAGVGALAPVALTTSAVGFHVASAAGAGAGAGATLTASPVSWATLATANGGVRFAGAAPDWLYKFIACNHMCVKLHRNPTPAAAANTGSGAAAAAAETCRLDVDVVSARGILGWYRPASTKPDKNDGVTSTPPTTHVRGTLDSEQYTSPTVVDSDKPKYGARFSFTVNPATQAWSELLLEVLEDEKKAAVPLLGSVSLPVHTILASRSAPEEWYSLIDGRTGLTFGELRLKYTLSAAKPVELSRVTRTTKGFADYFGYTDWTNAAEFPSVADYDASGGKMRRAAKGGAGGPKRPIRYQNGNFDLDLSYIVKDKLIAMALPGSSIAHSFASVKEFLNKVHANQYRVYNLCAESRYPVDKLAPAGAASATALVEYPFEELTAPSFPLLLHLCQDLERHLNAGANKVAVVHCRTGRGRTGLVLCAYLMYAKIVPTADDALLYFASKRTQNVKGVSYPTHVRYVRYFERFLREYLWVARPFPDSVVLHLQHIRFTTLPQVNAAGGCDPYFVCTGPYPYKTLLYDHWKANGNKAPPFHDKLATHVDLPCGDKRVALYGDVRFTFYQAHGSGDQQHERLFSFTVNTSFVQNAYVCLPKHEIDIASRDKEARRYDPNFKVELYFKLDKRS